MTKLDLKLSRIAFFMAVILMVLLFLFQLSGKILGSYRDIFALLIVAFQLYTPLLILDRLKLSPFSFGLQAQSLRAGLKYYFWGIFTAQEKTPAAAHFVKDLQFLGLAIVVIFIPYIALYYLFLFYISPENQYIIFDFKLPSTIWSEIPWQLFFIALPEEVFYRGFLQHGLNRALFQAKSKHSWKSTIWPVFITNLFFAFGHFAAEPDPSRLLTFFPGLIFSVLTIQAKSIWTAVIFHALCNILGIMLAFSFQWGPLGLKGSFS